MTKNYFSQLFSTSSYVSVKAFKALVPLILLPILTSVLTKEDFGVLRYFVLYLNFFYIFTALALPQYLRRNFNYFHKTEYEMVARSLLWLSFFLCLIFMLFLFFVVSTEQTPFSINYYFVFLIPIYFLSRFFIEIKLVSYQMAFKHKWFFFLSIFEIILELTLTILLLKKFPFWESRIIAIFAPAFLISVYFLLNNLRIIFQHNGKKRVLESVKYSTPLAINRALSMGFQLLLFTMVMKISGSEKLGIFAAAINLAGFSSQFFTAVNQSLQPRIYKELKKGIPVAFKNLKKIIYMYSFLCIFVSILFFLLEDYFVAVFLDGKFNGVIEIFYICIAGNLFKSLYFIFSNFLYNETKTAAILHIQLISIISTFLIYLAINFYWNDNDFVLIAAILFFAQSLFQFLFTCIQTFKLYYGYKFN